MLDPWPFTEGLSGHTEHQDQLQMLHDRLGSCTRVALASRHKQQMLQTKTISQDTLSLLSLNVHWLNSCLEIRGGFGKRDR